ncbi:glucan endo-1,3-beta-glucosidase 4-like [Glycine soja]|uniref:glucan endo-1,3-beta-glucosidase 4-like n=1 Tax=Glycine soja TaxID=3848 RepID=UPI00103F8A00|nr:glucan endo-1,3-beta-glucosidase 4-like [Glycine soja]
MNFFFTYIVFNLHRRYGTSPHTWTPTLSNNMKSHASYVYNDYYQRKHNSGGTCDFDGTATITTKDPSSSSCIFARSYNSSTRLQWLLEIQAPLVRV